MAHWLVTQSLSQINYSTSILNPIASSINLTDTPSAAAGPGLPLTWRRANGGQHDDDDG